MQNEDSVRIERGIEELHKKFDSCTKIINGMGSDVEVIKNNCKSRADICGKQFQGMEENLLKLTTNMNGDINTNGIRTRISKLESNNTSKEKILYLFIGALISGIFALGIFFLKHIFSLG